LAKNVAKVVSVTFSMGFLVLCAFFAQCNCLFTFLWR